MLRGKTDFETDDDPAPAIPSFGGDLPQGPTLNTSDAEDGIGTEDDRGSEDWQNEFVTWELWHLTLITSSAELIMSSQVLLSDVQ